MQQAQGRGFFVFFQGREQIHGILDPVAYHQGQGTGAVFFEDGCRQVFGFSDGQGLKALGGMDAPDHLREGRIRRVQCPQLRGGTAGGKVHTGQPARMQGGAAPQGTAGQGDAEALPEGLQLGGGGQARTHELHLVEDPEGIVVQQGEIQRPAEAAHGVAAVEGAGQKLVLGADEDGVVFGAQVPVPRHVSAHEHMHCGRTGEQARTGQSGGPLPCQPHGLLHQHAHGQAPDQPPGRVGILSLPLVEPGQQDGRCLAEAGGDLQYVGPGLVRQTLLVGIGGNAERCRIPVRQGWHAGLLLLEDGAGGPAREDRKHTSKYRTFIAGATRLKILGFFSAPLPAGTTGRQDGGRSSIHAFTGRAGPC